MDAGAQEQGDGVGELIVVRSLERPQGSVLHLMQNTAWESHIGL